MPSPRRGRSESYGSSRDPRLGLTVLRPGFIWGRGNTYLACLGQKFGPLHLVFGAKPGSR